MKYIFPSPRPAARHYVDVAFNLNGNDEQVATAYSRINRKRLAREAAAAEQAQLNDEHGFWDESSPDMRGVLAKFGGTRDVNSGVRPCHIGAYDQEGVHLTTWWFCDYNGDFVESYTFKHGVLYSHWMP